MRAHPNRYAGQPARALLAPVGVMLVIVVTSYTLLASLIEGFFL